ncbi:MAG: bacillithiol biosynthesis deacetylase BshB1 [Lentisphaerae bacterium]|nr:MAG: bacillithiol biosynthesis deacetylase BshB1 [Lentisphaerota bacterium]
MIADGSDTGRLDYMVLAAHPDDAEIFCGGSILRWRELGRKVGVVDCTRGEAGTSGSAEERIQEAAAATRVLGLDVRENLGLPDGQLQNCREHQIPIVTMIRRYRPRVLIAPLGPCRHPDHEAVYHLARAACFFAGNGKFPVDLPRYRPQRLFFHLEVSNDQHPSFVVDISNHFEKKMQAIQCYASQFYTPERGETGTWIGSRAFLERIRARAAFYGSHIGVSYGEPYYAPEMLRVDDPVSWMDEE